MGVYFKEDDNLPRPMYLQCDNCEIEIKIVTILEIDNYYKQGWLNKKFLYYCPKCSVEHKNSLQGES